MVTVEDVSGVLGVVVTGKSKQAGLYDQCVYSSADGSPLLVAETRLTDKATFEQSAPQNPGAVAVDGVGDEAWGGAGSVITFKNGIELTVIQYTGDAADAHVRQLAITGLARL